MKFKVGDRVAVYANNQRYTGQVYASNEHDSGSTIRVVLDQDRMILKFHVKQCRRLVKKKKPVTNKEVADSSFNFIAKAMSDRADSIMRMSEAMEKTPREFWISWDISPRATGMILVWDPTNDANPNIKNREWIKVREVLE